MSVDVLIAGAGLAGGLLALKIKQSKPETKLLMIDKAPHAPVEKTWSFHKSDLSPEWYDILQPYLRGEWDGQVVKFPDLSRHLQVGYASLDAKGLEAALQDRGVLIERGKDITSLSDDRVGFADGAAIKARAIVDARGFSPSKFAVNGWQKFVGIEYEMTTPHGQDVPMIMDASVEQIDGYRFVYLLPFSATKILVEDTRYSDSPEMDTQEIESKIQDYIQARGWQGQAIRREKGVLPIPLAFDAQGFWDSGPHGVPIGMRAELFHPVTGYSLPVAAKLADRLAQSQLTTQAMREEVREFALKKAHKDRYLRLLNRMLFRGGPPEQRYRLLERFYGLPEPLIKRFYAGELTRSDQMRIITGKPPIKIRDAVNCLSEKRVLGEAK